MVEILAFIVSMLMGHYLAIFLHEIGHACVYFSLGIPVTRVNVGSGRILFSIKVRDAVFRFRLFPDGGNCTRFTEPEMPSPFGPRLFLPFIGGPVANAVFFGIFYFFAGHAAGVCKIVLLGFSFANLNSFVTNMIPISAFTSTLTVKAGFRLHQLLKTQ
ncbi:site-2 protease family protein [Desulfofundulus salinus]|uniref:Peptidase M50 domain-containing protein n=1 Tax=Desulfofundulus salinus TaxID=2419843 RepID=A0A494X0M8_9FIRM|nr:site-2 protease family protein [Desulfofundulus salinum]RKO66384.1 hypothetical protein D7024_05125 [Desulfofundulus salinum]